ncbi:hypothetical protein [Psychroserpens sp.]|uniref:hypothetical protein n=1 Tax=Psychroserpens sp. TaxID=2020870 RepID=UPI00385FC9A6
MKTQFIYFVICLILVNCKEPKPELTFKHSDKKIVIDCNPNYSKILNEALHEFETNIIKYSTLNKPNLNNEYRSFLTQSSRHQINYNNITEQHTLDIFEELKNIDDLWVLKNNKLTLNYNHEIFSCIGENIQDKDIKTTFNALLSTNSLSMRMMNDLLMSKSYRLVKDKYLATFVALELYYSKLSKVDLSKKQVTTKDTNTKAQKDPHAGHNHD